MKLHNLEVIPSQWVSDYESVMRSWKERLFTRPWRPFQKTKSVYSPKAYKVLDEQIIMSFQSYEILKKELESKKENE